MNKKSTIRRSEEQWRQIVVAQETSGQSVSEYCRGKDFRENNFYAWRRRLRNKIVGQSGKFLEVRSVDRHHEPQSPLCIHVPGGYRLEVPQGLDRDMIKSVLKVLASL